MKYFAKDMPLVDKRLMVVMVEVVMMVMVVLMVVVLQLYVCLVCHISRSLADCLTDTVRLLASCT